MSRSRVIGASPAQVWELIVDPYNLPRWWPRTTRVEDVREEEPGRAAWTAVMATERGTPVRADYHRADLVEGARLRWEQRVEGSPFERILRSSAVEIALTAEAGGTKVTLTLDEALRGLARLGAAMIGGAAKRRLDDALDGIERALVRGRT